VALRVPAPPVAYAIPNDRHEVLHVLLSHRASRDVIKKDFLVHEACKFRAKRCLRILVACLPEQVGLHTLLHVGSPWPGYVYLNH